MNLFSLVSWIHILFSSFLAALVIESRTQAKQALSSISNLFIIFDLSQGFTKLLMVALNVRSF